MKEEEKETEANNLIKQDLNKYERFFKTHQLIKSIQTMHWETVKLIGEFKLPFKATLLPDFEHPDYEEYAMFVQSLKSVN